MTVVNIGEKIRKLRKEKGISQDTLTQYLGVSFQAVSKWENGLAMPDVTMFPAIAFFFEISIDELFDYDRMKLEEKVITVCHKAYEIRDDNPQKAEKILREGLKKFPGNVLILNNLLYPLMIQENREEEIIRIVEILAETPNVELEVKLDAFRIMAETYHKLGDLSACRKVIEKIPELYFSATELKARLLEGQESLENASLQQQVSGYTLIEMQMIMAKFYEDAGDKEKAKKKYSTVAKIIDAFEGDTEPLEGIKLSEQDAVRRFRRKAENVILKWTDDVI